VARSWKPSCRDDNDNQDIESGGWQDSDQVGAVGDLRTQEAKLVIKGMGFTRLNQVIERPDNPAIRGMVKKVPHLVEIVK